MFATFANLGLLMLLMCLGCVIAGGVTLIIVLWSIDKEAQRDLRLNSQNVCSFFRYAVSLAWYKRIANLGYTKGGVTQA